MGDGGQKGYKLPVIREISPGDVMYSMASILNETVLFTLKLLKE